LPEEALDGAEQVVSVKRPRFPPTWNSRSSALPVPGGVAAAASGLAKRASASNAKLGLKIF
jgi:hypothetical protein